MSSKWWLVLAASGVLALGVAACGDDDDDGGGDTPSGLTGEIRIDGSSTVGPLTEAIAEEFNAENPDVNVTVGTSGTGGGFEKFCAGETDISDASRAIEEDEVKTCEAGGIAFEEIQVANDALTVVVNPNNPVTCMTVDQLKPGLGARRRRSRTGARSRASSPRSTRSSPCTRRAPTRARSTSSPRRSTVRRALSARPTSTTSVRTTTPPSPASPAPTAGWATSASPTTRRTRTR